MKKIKLKKVSYKSGNPIKGLLKTKKTQVKLKGGEPINLAKAQW